MYFCIKMYFSQYKLNSEEEIRPWCINMCRKRHWDFKLLQCYSWENVLNSSWTAKNLNGLKIFYAKHFFPLIEGGMWLMGWIWSAKCWFAVNVDVVEVFWDACSMFCGFSPAWTRNNVVKISF